MEEHIHSTGDTESSTYIGFHSVRSSFWCIVVFETLDKEFPIWEALEALQVSEEEEVFEMMLEQLVTS